MQNLRYMLNSLERKPGGTVEISPKAIGHPHAIQSDGTPTTWPQNCRIKPKNTAF